MKTKPPSLNSEYIDRSPLSLFCQSAYLSVDSGRSLSASLLVINAIFSDTECRMDSEEGTDIDCPFVVEVDIMLEVTCK